MIAYYLQRSGEVDAYLQSREEEAEQGWGVIEADPKNKALRERVAAAACSRVARALTAQRPRRI